LIGNADQRVAGAAAQSCPALKAAVQTQGAFPGQRRRQWPRPLQAAKRPCRFGRFATLSGSSRSPNAVVDFVPKAAIDSMDGSGLAFSVWGVDTQRCRTEIQ